MLGVHEGKIPSYTCDICEKRFTSINGLRSHFKSIHEKIKDIECLICEKRFTDKSILNSHISNIHEKKNFTKCGCVQKTKNMTETFASTDLSSCTFECQLEKVAFMSCLFVTIWFTCMSAMPCVACILRFVEPENKSMSMGIANIIVR